MIYAAKPQKGNKSIQANTNNPPQDPLSEIIEEPISKVSWFKRFIQKIQGIFRRK